MVSVYQIGTGDQIFSTEICMGPHINHTSQIGIFSIIKEESSSSSTRRIKAILK